MCKLTNVTVLYFVAILNAQFTDAHFENSLKMAYQKLIKLHLFD